MKYYIIAGEASGDLHGSNLMKALFEEDKSADIRFWGGDLMQSVGGTLVSHYKERAFMGFVEVLVNIRKIFGFISFCKKDIETYQPDVIIFIDNSGFNLRIAKWAKQQGLRTNYYISPQVWASRAGRVEAIKRDVDKMFVILPFEKEFYDTYGYNVDFVGHPLIDAVSDFKDFDHLEFKKNFNLDQRPIIALLPGSRKQEIQKMLPVMLSVIDMFDDFQFVIAGAPSQSNEFYQEFIKQGKVTLIGNQTYKLLSISHSAIVTSGTAALEAALFKVPQVVCYKANWISYQIAKRIITLKYISLVNLIMNKEVVTELIQNDFTTERLTSELFEIIKGSKREILLEEYHNLQVTLGNGGASKNVAFEIVKSLNF